VGVDEAVNQIMRPVANVVSQFIFYAVPLGGAELPLIVVWLIAGGLFFTLYLGFINVTGFRHALHLVSGRYANAAHPGEVSQFQALATAVSGTVGIGNIAGVAVAISMGGPGATLWLIIAGLLGMSTKFAECTLAVKFRRTHSNGTVSGGPMYYLQHGLAQKNLPFVGRALGIFYATSMVLGCLGIGNMFQSNQATAILIDVTGGSASLFYSNAWVLGVVMAVVVAIVIVGGIKSIAKTTEKLVPFMAVLYVVTALVILALNFDRLPGAISQIWQGAFTADGIAGGMIGVVIIGFRRAVFSNEAGQGTGPHAAAAAEVDHPAQQGLVQAFSVYVDTLFVCSATAFMILITNQYYVSGIDAAVSGGLLGSDITISSPAFTQLALQSVIGGTGKVFVAVALFFFAFTTLLAYYYIAETNVAYIRRSFRIPYELTVLKLVLMGAVFYGTVRSADIAWAMGDIGVGLMAWLNIIGILILFIMGRPALKALKDYERQRNAGVEKYTFDPDALGIKNADFWKKQQ